MKKENINKIFESIADKYDLMNDLMSFGLHRKWKEKFVDLINLNLKNIEVELVMTSIKLILSLKKN